jgi:hypothetical protein
MGSLDLLGDRDQEFPIPTDPLAITRTDHRMQVSVRSPISTMTNLVSLEVMNYPDNSFEPSAHLGIWSSCEFITSPR